MADLRERVQKILESIRTRNRFGPVIGREELDRDKIRIAKTADELIDMFPKPRELTDDDIATEPDYDCTCATCSHVQETLDTMDGLYYLCDCGNGINMASFGCCYHPNFAKLKAVAKAKGAHHG